MSFLNQNAFILGVFLFLCSCLSILIFTWLCLLWKIKIQQVGVFTNPVLYKRRINGIDYILGWLPLGAHITPLGMLPEDFNSDTISDEEKPHAFLAKSKTKQRIFKSTNYFVWFFILIISLYALTNDHNIVQNFIDVEAYVITGIKAMFKPMLRPEFLSHSGVLIAGKSKILLAIILFINFFTIATPLFNLLGWFLDENKKGGLIVKWLAIIAFIFITYLVIWKIPAFIFSFFPLIKILAYLLSCLMGAYLVGFIMFFVIIISVNLKSGFVKS